VGRWRSATHKNHMPIAQLDAAQLFGVTIFDPSRFVILGVVLLVIAAVIASVVVVERSGLISDMTEMFDEDDDEAPGALTVDPALDELA